MFADPFVENRVWAATKDAIYRSDDRGDHWRSMSRGLAHAGPLYVSASFAERDTLFAVSREGDVLRTTNAGESWVRVGGLTSVTGGYWTPSGLAADPNEPTRVWASAARLERSDTSGQRFTALMNVGVQVLGATRNAVYATAGDKLLRMSPDGVAMPLPIANASKVAEGKDRLYVGLWNPGAAARREQ